MYTRQYIYIILPIVKRYTVDHVSLIQLPNVKLVSGNTPPCCCYIFHTNISVNYKLITACYVLFLKLLCTSIIMDFTIALVRIMCHTHPEVENISTPLLLTSWFQCYPYLIYYLKRYSLVIIWTLILPSKEGGLLIQVRVKYYYYYLLLEVLLQELCGYFQLKVIRSFTTFVWHFV